MRTEFRLLGLIAVLANLGCESNPTNYYYLEPFRSTETVTTGSTVRLAVDGVYLPAYLDRPNIVVQKRTNRLEVSAVEQWAEPLDQGVARVLRANLGRLLGKGQISVVPTDFTDVDGKIFVHVSRFEVIDAGEAVLEAFWRIVRSRDGRELVFQRSEYREMVVGEGYAAITAALNDVLTALSRDIADAATDHAAQLGRRQSRSRG